MSELQKQKLNILTQLRGLCAHCSCDSSRPHRCPVQQISARIQALHGVPLIVNNEFKGVLWAHI